MKKLFFILSMLLTLNVQADSKIPVKMIKILDGDTIKVKIDTGNKFSIRFTGIDCYETAKIHRAYKQAYLDNISIEEVIKKGDIAARYLEKLYSKTKEVSFEYKGIDIYGRALGIVYFDRINVNQELVDKGYCKEFIYKEK